MTNPTQPIRLIAVDLDGTLINSRHELSPQTEQALRRAMARGIQVIIATGRPRRTATAYIRQLGLNTPGVFLQGLNIHNGDGTLRHEWLMDPETAQRVAAFAEANDYSVMLYNSQTIIARARNALTDLMLQYHEPLPEFVGARIVELPGKIPINKFVFVDTPERIAVIRRELTAHVNGTATILNSLPHLLETLPPGTSKGGGLKWLLEDMGIPAGHVLAIGDGENDIEMIQMAGIGVAMGNAPEHVKRVADHVTATNDEDGAALAVERFALAGT